MPLFGLGPNYFLLQDHIYDLAGHCNNFFDDLSTLWFRLKPSFSSASGGISG